MRKRVRRKIVKRAMGKMKKGETLTFQERKLVGEDFISAWDVAMKFVDNITNAFGCLVRSLGVAFNQAKEQIQEAAKRAAEEELHERAGCNTKVK